MPDMYNGREHFLYTCVPRAPILLLLFIQTTDPCAFFSCIFTQAALHVSTPTTCKDPSHCGPRIECVVNRRSAPWQSLRSDSRTIVFLPCCRGDSLLDKLTDIRTTTHFTMIWHRGGQQAALAARVRPESSLLQAVGARSSTAISQRARRQRKGCNSAVCAMMLVAGNA
jgi:hypothetical protein